MTQQNMKTFIKKGIAGLLYRELRKCMKLIAWFCYDTFETRWSRRGPHEDSVSMGYVAHNKVFTEKQEQ